MPASAPLFPALLPASLPASTQLARYRGSRPVSAATSKEQVNRSHQERDLTGLCLFCCVSLLGSVGFSAVGGWSLRLYCFFSAAVVPTCRFSVRSGGVCAFFGGCLLRSLVVFRAVPCSAPMGGFPLHTAGAAFLWVWRGLFSRLCPSVRCCRFWCFRRGEGELSKQKRFRVGCGSRFGAARLVRRL